MISAGASQRWKAASGSRNSKLEKTQWQANNPKLSTCTFQMRLLPTCESACHGRDSLIKRPVSHGLMTRIDYWRDGFDWRAQEARLNSFPQYKVSLQGIDLHFMHVLGNGPDPHPLLLSHGWPGSVFEFLELIPRLTDPDRFGADPADAFTVVVPSLPGYGLSFTSGQARLGIEAIADCFAELMTDVLG